MEGIIARVDAFVASNGVVLMATVADTSGENAFRAAERLIKLIDLEELDELGRALGLRKGFHQDDIVQCMARLAQYDMGRLAPRISSQTLAMLRDIVLTLERLGVSARTTGCILVIADPARPGAKSEVEVSPEAAGVILKWKERRQGNLTSVSLKRVEEARCDLERDLPEEVSIFEMLKPNVWSSRPQLYEVWVLAQIVLWLAGRGYSVNVLRSSNESRGVRWNLASAKDSEPCARITGTDGAASYLFYQLYQPSADMPDLCLLSGPEPGSPRIWSVDAKHSQMKSYSCRAYKMTAERYRDSFGSPLSICSEYFPRAEFLGNPISFSPGALLVHDCRPGGGGLALLLELLSCCHPSSLPKNGESRGDTERGSRGGD